MSCAAMLLEVRWSELWPMWKRFYCDYATCPTYVYFESFQVPIISVVP